jgi:hypothetical protein
MKTQIKTLNNLSWCIGIALAIVGSLLAESASAALITVNNAGFDDESLVDNAATAGAPAGWATDDKSGNWIAAWNPLGTDFTGATGDGTPEGGNGANVAAIDIGAAAGDGLLYWRSDPTTGSKLEAGTYTLTVALGIDAPEAIKPAKYTLFFGSDNKWDLASVSGLGTNLPRGSLEDHSCSVTIAGDNAHLGETLVVAIQAFYVEGGSANWVLVDKVRLDFVAEPIPEPGTLVLMASGLLGLFAYDWRKRK